MEKFDLLGDSLKEAERLRSACLPLSKRCWPSRVVCLRDKHWVGRTKTKRGSSRPRRGLHTLCSELIDGDAHTEEAPCDPRTREGKADVEIEQKRVAGVLFYYCLKGRFPWQKATIMCKPYWEWEQWLKRKNPQLPRRCVDRIPFTHLS